MPKAFQINPQHTSQAVWQAYRKATCGTQKRRLQVIALLLEGKSRQEIEEVTRYCRRSISDAILKYNSSGLEGLRNLQKENRGRTAKISHEQKSEIEAVLKREHARESIWSGEKLVAYIREQYKIEVSLSTAYRLLKELGYSL